LGVVNAEGKILNTSNLVEILPLMHVIDGHILGEKVKVTGRS